MPLTPGEIGQVKNNHSLHIYVLARAKWELEGIQRIFICKWYDFILKWPLKFHKETTTADKYFHQSDEIQN